LPSIFLIFFAIISGAMGFDHEVEILDASSTSFVFRVVPLYTPKFPPNVLIIHAGIKSRPELVDATSLVYKMEIAEDDLRVFGRYQFVIWGKNVLDSRMNGASVKNVNRPYLELSNVVPRKLKMLVFSDKDEDGFIHYIVGELSKPFKIEEVYVDGKPLNVNVLHYDGTFFCSFKKNFDDGKHSFRFKIVGPFLSFDRKLDARVLAGYLFPVGGLPVEAKIQFLEPKYYLVKPGDTLYDIAKRFNTTVGYLMLINRIVDPNNIIAGRRLKIGRVTFSESPLKIIIDLKRAKLQLMYGNSVIASYPVALGRSDATPPGDYHIIYKERNPALYWYGEYIPPGVIINGLGSYWLQLSQPRYGIHGTTKPWEIGKRISHGCIRMMDNQAGIIFDVASVGTKVHVIRDSENSNDLVTVP